MSDKIDKYKGVVEIEILGEQRGFKFGMAAMAQLCQLERTDWKGVQEKFLAADITTTANLFFVTATQYARLAKITEPTYEDVLNWVDHLDEGQQAKIIQAFFYHHIEKEETPNLTAP